MGDWGGLVAIALAMTVFALFAQGVHAWKRLKIDNPSPTFRQWLVEWRDCLVRRDRETETDDETGTGYRLIEDDGKTRVEWLRKPAASVRSPRLADGGNPSAKGRAAWVAEQVSSGAATQDIVAEGMQRWRASRATMFRAVAAARRRAGK